MGILLFAQNSSIDQIVGGTGLVTTIVNGGVIVWLLMKGLPDKDKLVTSLLEKKDKQLAEKDAQLAVIEAHRWAAIEGMLKENGENTRYMGELFKASLKTIVDDCKEERALLHSYIPKRTEEGNP